MLQHSRALLGHQTESGNDLSRVINREDDQVIAKEDGKSIVLSDLVAIALATCYFASLLRYVGCQEFIAKWEVTARQLITQYNRG